MLGERLLRIGSGFKILSMNMRDASTGKVLWQCDDWDMAEGVEKQVHFPKELL